MPLFLLGPPIALKDEHGLYSLASYSFFF